MNRIKIVSVLLIMISILAATSALGYGTVLGERFTDDVKKESQTNQAQRNSDFRKNADLNCMPINYIKLAVQMLAEMQANKPEEAESSSGISKAEAGEQRGIAIEIKIGSELFNARLTDSASGRAFAEKLPLTVEMGDLNGNEKYYFMPKGLPVGEKSTGSVNSGDIMLYGQDCLVLFYESFPSSYTYTKLGVTENASELAEALGAGPTQVTWSLK